MNTSSDRPSDGDRGGISLTEALGIVDDFAPEYLAPPLDRDLIRRYVRGELKGRDRRQVSDMIAAFRSWRVELQEVLREDAAGSQGGVSREVPEG